MRKFGTRAVLVFSLLILIAIIGLLARAQKSEDDTEARGLTLADLGVTEAQKTKIKALWELKRQKHAQAIEDLKTMNRLAKDSMAPEGEIGETLKALRQRRQEQEQQLRKTEEELIKTLPLRAQLHLTILGVLENGLPYRYGAVSQRKKKMGNEEIEGEK